MAVQVRVTPTHPTTLLRPCVNTSVHDMPVLLGRWLTASVLDACSAAHQGLQHSNNLDPDCTQAAMLLQQDAAPAPNAHPATPMPMGPMAPRLPSPVPGLDTRAKLPGPWLSDPSALASSPDMPPRPLGPAASRGPGPWSRACPRACVSMLARTGSRRAAAAAAMVCRRPPTPPVRAAAVGCPCVAGATL